MTTEVVKIARSKLFFLAVGLCLIGAIIAGGYAESFKFATGMLIGLSILLLARFGAIGLDLICRKIDKQN